MKIPLIFFGKPVQDLRKGVGRTPIASGGQALPISWRILRVSYIPSQRAVPKRSPVLRCMPLLMPARNDLERPKSAW